MVGGDASELSLNQREPVLILMTDCMNTIKLCFLLRLEPIRIRNWSPGRYSLPLGFKLKDLQSNSTITRLWGYMSTPLSTKVATALYTALPLVALYHSTSEWLPCALSVQSLANAIVAPFSHLSLILDASSRALCMSVDEGHGMLLRCLASTVHSFATSRRASYTPW